MARIQVSRREYLWSVADRVEQNATTWVYCIHEDGSPNGPCKVGIASNVEKRLSGLQGGNWRRLVVAWVVRVDDRNLALKAEDHCLTKHRPDIYSIRREEKLASEWVQASPAALLETVAWVIREIGDEIREVAT